MKQKDDSGAWRSYLVAFWMEKDAHDFLGTGTEACLGCGQSSDRPWRTDLDWNMTVKKLLMTLPPPCVRFDDRGGNSGGLKESPGLGLSLRNDYLYWAGKKKKTNICKDSGDI